MNRPFTTAAWLAALLALSPNGWAYDFEVTARTEGYGYQLRRYDGASISFLNRRRITQYLGLRIFNLLDDGLRPVGRSGRAPELIYLHALMRFDTDFGAFMRPQEPVSELQNNQLDLMIGAVEGRNLLRGWLDFTLGRQFDAELMDLFAFDGLRLRVNLPGKLFVESHVGVQTARARPFSAAILEIDGTSGDPSSEAISPTFGVAGGVDDLVGLSLRLAYRGTASKAEPGLVEAPDPEDEIWGVDEELVFLSLSYRLPVVDLRSLFGMRYNLLTGSFDDVQVALLQRLGRRHHIEVEYLRSRPHFDGDSIFNLFALEPFNEVAGRYALALLDSRLELSTRLGYRRFWIDESETDRVEPGAISASLGATWRGSRLRATLDGYYLAGLETTTLGGDIWGRWLTASWISVEGRLSLVSSDDLSYADSLLNLGLELGSTVRLVRGVRLHLSLEDNINRLYNSALRLLAVLDLEFAP